MNYRTSIFTLLFSFIATSHSIAGQTTDFYILGNPSVCSLFDQYEQSITVSKMKTIPPNAPFQIVKKNVVMGDQITQAMRLSYLQKTFYLLLDDREKPVGLPPKASAKRYQRCTPWYDTLIISSSSLNLYRNYPAGGKSVRLKKGETVIRIFTYRGITFLYRPGLSSIFGWTNAKKRAFRKPNNKQISKSGGYTTFHVRIMKRLQDANERYKALFSYFNGITQEQKSVPQWTYTASGKKHHYTLEGSQVIISQLANSTRFIIVDIEHILLSKAFLVRYDKGVISIGPR